MGMGMDEDGMVAGMEMLYDENGEPLEDGAGFGEQEEEGWVEVCGTVLEESGKEGPNSVVYVLTARMAVPAMFDPVEEMVWAGTSTGRLVG
eukprot:3108249-Rhodomonas_salina.3